MVTIFLIMIGLFLILFVLLVKKVKRLVKENKLSEQQAEKLYSQLELIEGITIVFSFFGSLILMSYFGIKWAPALNIPAMILFIVSDELYYDIFIDKNGHILINRGGWTCP